MSLYSKVEICNLALALLGEKRVESLTENRNARIANELYNMAVDHVMTQTDWSFAHKYIELNMTDTETDDTPEGYFEYQLPPKCLTPLDVAPLGTREKWFINGDYLYSPRDPVYLHYTERQTDSSKFTMPFINILANYLGYLMALPITGEKAMADNMFRAYQVALQESMVVEANIGSDYPPTDGDHNKDSFVDPDYYETDEDAEQTNL